MSVLRKIGRILLLIGGIFALLNAVSCFLMIIGGAVVALLDSVIVKALADAGTTVQAGTFAIIGIALAVVSLFLAVFSLVAGILGIKGFKHHEKKLYIENIVFGVLSFELLPIVGAILGLIALAKEKKAMPQPAEAE